MYTCCNMPAYVGKCLIYNLSFIHWHRTGSITVARVKAVGLDMVDFHCLDGTGGVYPTNVSIFYPMKCV